MCVEAWRCSSIPYRIPDVHGWWAFGSGRFIPWDKTPGTFQTEDLLCPRDGLNCWETNESFCHRAHKPVTTLTELCRRLYAWFILVINLYIWGREEVGKPEGKRLLGRPRHRWVDNIKMDLQEVECGGVD